MPAPTTCPTGDDLLALVAWIDPVADRFENAWRQGPGIPAIAHFVAGASGDARRHLLSELVKIDLEYRWRHGERPALEDYLTLWPELGRPAGGPSQDLRAHIEQLACRFPTTPLPVAAPTLPGLAVEALLGQGSFGCVYRARETGAPGRTVAVKVPRAGALVSPVERLSLLNEASSAARLSHPAIVHIFGVRHDDNIPCIISEYIDGPTLAERLRQGRPTAREAAELARQLALALQCAHANGVIHRDLKPGNVLLDAQGQPHLTDFGLARCRGGETLTEPGAVLGTLPYMSPEQAAGQGDLVDARSDIFSLGAVLYEMLTGTTANGCALPRVQPVPPRRCDPHIPRDLETICLKALALAPEQRYQTAAELADDLRRFLADEPIRARPAGRLERVARWCRNHPGATVLSGLLLVAVAGTGWLAWAASRAREQDLAAAVLQQQMQRIRLTQRDSGWSVAAWQLASRAAAIRRDEELRTQAAALLAGLDLERIRRLDVDAVSAMAFDPGQERLLVGGSDRLPARVLDLRTGSIIRSASRPGTGPVVFRGGSAALLTVTAGPALVLQDLAGHRAPPGHPGHVPVACSLPKAPGAAGVRLRAACIAEDGGRVACVVERPGAVAELAVWSGTGQLLGRWPGDARLLALSRRGDRLAGCVVPGRLQGVGTPSRKIVVWSVPEGGRLAELNLGPVPVHCLAFSPDGRRLAVGAGDGTLGLWDWSTNLYRPCFGALYEIYSVAFSPDGTLLASGGRTVHLWDTATGRRLLDLDAGDRVRALAFSPDGRALAVSSGTPASGLSLWRLHNGRGIVNLRGLGSPISKVRFAPGGEYVAALSHRWQVALWQRETGQLLHCFDVRPGLSADNAALAFSGDGRLFAFCAGSEARLWEVGSGRALARWSDLPPGLTDELAFTPGGELLLLRTETTDDRVPRFGDDPARYPRLCRLRELRRRGPRSPLLTLERFNLRVLCAVASGDGRWFAVEGHGKGREGKYQELCVIDGWNARVCWSRRVTPVSSSACLAIEPGGKGLGLFRHHDVPARADWLDLATGQQQRSWSGVFWAVSAGGERLLGQGPHRAGRHPGFTLVRGTDNADLVVLGIDSSPGHQASFDTSGRFAAWGHSDGTVRLCDLEEVRRRLSELGLGWSEP